MSLHSQAVKELIRQRITRTDPSTPTINAVLNARHTYRIIYGRDPRYIIMHGSLQRKLIEEGFTSFELQAFSQVGGFFDMRPFFTYDCDPTKPPICAR
jgi:hypothetical protein